VTRLLESAHVLMKNFLEIYVTKLQISNSQLVLKKKFLVMELEDVISNQRNVIARKTKMEKNSLETIVKLELQNACMLRIKSNLAIKEKDFNLHVVEKDSVMVSKAVYVIMASQEMTVKQKMILKSKHV